MPGKFVISLDFELMWGVRDHTTRECYGERILQARKTLPLILNKFAKHRIRATWATVGFLFCEGRDDLVQCTPKLLPQYTQTKLSNYSYLGDLGKNEADDPYHFAPTLIDLISCTPGQEIATHTMSHYYCLEPGQSLAEFSADLDAAIAIALRRGVQLRSIVFPRNQYAMEHIEACHARGISHFRGNQQSWAYSPTEGRGQTWARRGIRLLDSYLNITGDHAFSISDKSPVNVPASQFLRPAGGSLRPLYRAHIATVCRRMSAAAKMGRNFHLWWHPHNFGADTEENLGGLALILKHFIRLREEYGMESAAMGDFIGDIK